MVFIHLVWCVPVTEHSLSILYEYCVEESQRNENALTVAVNNFMMSRRFDRDMAERLMVLIDRREYFLKIEKDLYTLAQIMKSM